MPWPFRKPSQPSDAPAIPPDSYIVAEGTSDGFPETWIVNRALLAFEPKATFPWHLSIIIEMKDTYEFGFPTKPEQAVLGEIGKEIGRRLKANANALLLASITWKGTRQLLYRVRDSEVANAELQTVVSNPAAPRAMEYRMEQDLTWKLAEPSLGYARMAKA